VWEWEEPPGGVSVLDRFDSPRGIEKSEFWSARRCSQRATRGLADQTSGFGRFSAKNIGNKLEEMWETTRSMFDYTVCTEVDTG